MPAGGLDVKSGSGKGAELFVKKSPTSRPSRLAEGTPLRYYLCMEVLGSTVDSRKAFYIPVLGAGLVRFGADEGAGAADLGKGTDEADLRSEVTLPHLWATVKAISAENGTTAMTIHLEKAEGLGPLRVSQSGVEHLGREMALRTKDGDPIRAGVTVFAQNVPRVVPGDYLSVPDDGVDLNVVPFKDGVLYRWKSLDPEMRPTVLPIGPWLRYYVCTEVSCSTEDMKQQFWVPVLGVGVVQYGGKGE